MTIEAPAAPKPFWTQTRVLIAVFVSLCAALGAWYLLVLRQDYVVLYDDLRGAQAAAVIAQLEKDGTRYRLSDGGRRVLVPATQSDAARVRMASSDVSLGGVDGFELFNEADMGLTDFAQKIRYQRAIQGELARTIMMMDGVIEARVHISMPERTLFRGERRPAAAAVSLLMRAPEDETPQRIEGVQRLVAASVPDLSSSDVVVLNGRGEIISSHATITERALDRAPRETALIETMIAAVRSAVPHRRFTLSIEQAPPALEGGAPEATYAAARLIHVFTTSSLTPDEKARVEGALRQARLLQEDDALLFRVDIAALDSPTPSTAIAAPARRTAPEPAHSEISGVWISALLLLLVLAGGFAGGVRMLRAKLTPADQEAFAERLKAGLAQIPRERANV